MRIFRPRIWREAASLFLIAKTGQPCSFQPAEVPVRATKHPPPPLAKSMFTHKYDHKTLFLKRGTSVKFMPSVSVFPGGGISAADLSSTWLSVFKSAGIDEADLISQLNVNRDSQKTRPFMFEHLPHFDKLPQSSSPSPSIIALDIAFRICAIRETFEESGILIARPFETCKGIRNSGRSKLGQVFRFSSKDVLKEWQKKVIEDAENFILLCREQKLCPDVWALYEWSEWLTPTTFFKTRYDTIFYACFIDHFPEVVLGDSELVDSQYLTPPEAISRYYANDVVLAFPQIYEQLRLATFTNVEALISHTAERENLGTECWLPVIYKAADGLFTVLPGDSMFPKEPDFEGNRPQLVTPLTLEEARNQSEHLNRGEWRDDWTRHPLTLFCNIELALGQRGPLYSYSLNKSLRS